MAQTGGRFSVNVGGFPAGVVTKFSGGKVSGKKNEAKHGGEILMMGNTLNPEVSEYSITGGISMGQSFLDWIMTTLNFNPKPQSGVIVQGDDNYKQIAHNEFRHAYLTELQLPKVDANGSGHLEMTAKWKARSSPTGGMRMAKGPDMRKSSGGVITQPQWSTQRFEFGIDQIHGSESTGCDYYTIEISPWKQTVTAKFDSFGRCDLSLGEVAFPEITVTLPVSTLAHPDNAKAWADYTDKYIGSTESGVQAFDAAKYVSGHLTYKSPNGQKLCTVNFSDAYMTEGGFSDAQAQSGDPLTYQAKFQIGHMKIKFEPNGQIKV